MVGSNGTTEVPASWAGYVCSDRTATNGPVIDDQDEELLKTYPDVLLTLGDRTEQGAGTLYVTSRRAVWLSAETPSLGYAIPFTEVVMHAVCTDLSAFPRPCIYAQLQGGFEDEEYGEEEAAGEVDDDEAAVSLDMRLSPADASCWQ